MISSKLHSFWIFLLAISSEVDSFEDFDLPCTSCVLRISTNSDRRISSKETLPTLLVLLCSSSSTLSRSLTVCTPCTWSKFPSFLLNSSESIQDFVDALLAYEFSEEKRLKLIQFVTNSYDQPWTIIHKENELKHTHNTSFIQSHLKMNTIQGIGTIMSVLFIHEINYIVLRFFITSILFSSMLLSSTLLSNTIQQQIYLRSGSLSSSPSCLLCPITITISYYPIRVSTLYLQLLTVVEDFTNKIYLKTLFPKYLNNSFCFWVKCWFKILSYWDVILASLTLKAMLLHQRYYVTRRFHDCTSTFLHFTLIWY